MANNIWREQPSSRFISSDLIPKRLDSFSYKVVTKGFFELLADTISQTSLKIWINTNWTNVKEEKFWDGGNWSNKPFKIHNESIWL